jgi:hypothetical protein
MSEPATHEREITEPVDLALPDGRTLNPAARGWSRHPLQRANLRGRWGRTKRWDYWAILAGDLVLSAVYADVDYLGLADVWWADLATGETGGRGVNVPFARGFALPEIPGSDPLRIARTGFALEISDDASGATHLHASWRERDGRPGSLEATVELPPGHESLNVVIPWSERTFQYTSKHQARPARGTLEVGERLWEFGDASGQEAWGVLDVGRGRWPYRTRWNWGGGAGRTRDGRHVVGLQIGGKWTEGTGATENGILVDGMLTKLGRELVWSYDWNEPLKPWHVEDPGGRLALELTPRYDRHARTKALVLATETHQVFGTWSGWFLTDAEERLEFAGVQGFAEESRSRW